MTITERILSGIKQTLETGDQVKIDLREASAITGSGLNVGGRTHFDDAFAALRYANPFRQGARNIKVPGNSAVQFVAKTGNAANSTNPWGYTVSPNSGSPNINTSIWQLPTRVISAQLPVRSAVLTDVNGLQSELVEDLMMEFAQLEGASCGLNNDQAGSTTTATGGTDGLRGLNSYPGAAGAAAAFGTSGTAITNGRHTIASVGFNNTAGLDMETLVDMANVLPAQYWSMPGTAWMMHPTAIQALREYAHQNGAYSFVETGSREAGSLLHVFGFPVIPNPYLDPMGTVGAKPVYLANWPRFMTIADVEEMTVQAMEQTTPGFVTLYAEKRMVSTVRDVFAGVRSIET
jgi:HK97 family phage major capsid protein